MVVASQATLAVKAGREQAWHRRLRAKRQQARRLLAVAAATLQGHHGHMTQKKGQDDHSDLPYVVCNRSTGGCGRWRYCFKLGKKPCLCGRAWPAAPPSPPKQNQGDGERQGRKGKGLKPPKPKAKAKPDSDADARAAGGAAAPDGSPSSSTSKLTEAEVLAFLREKGYTGLEQVQAPEPAKAKADEGDQKPTHSQQFYAWRKKVKRVNGLKDKLSKKSKALDEMREALQWAEKEYREMEEELNKAQKAEEAQAVHAEAVKSSGGKAGDEPAKAEDPSSEDDAQPPHKRRKEKTKKPTSDKVVEEAMDPFKTLLANTVIDDGGKLKAGIDIAGNAELQQALGTMLAKLQQHYLATLAAEQQGAAAASG